MASLLLASRFLFGFRLLSLGLPLFFLSCVWPPEIFLDFILRSLNLMFLIFVKNDSCIPFNEEIFLVFSTEFSYRSKTFPRASQPTPLYPKLPHAAHSLPTAPEVSPKSESSKFKI